MNDWQKPYRSQDESGSPEAAGQIGWTWIREIAERLHGDGDRTLQIDRQNIEGGGGVTVLYRGTETIAVATTWRDPMNFTILVRWAARGVA